MKKCVLILILFSCKLIAQQPDKEGGFVKWLTLEEAMKKTESTPKPMLVDFYTDWCGWCKTMMKTTYSNQALAEYINTYFYPVKFNAEGKDTINYLGEKYFPASDAPRTPHPLAVKLLNNKLMYPTTLFLNGYDKAKKEFKTNMIAAGYLEQQKLEPILIFTLENAGRNSTYDNFSESFRKTFYDSSFAATTKKPDWLTAVDAFGKTSKLKNDRKTLVMINTEWCSSCKVMKTTTFNDTLDAKYLREKYNLVDFDPQISDTLFYKGEKLGKLPDPATPFHQLAFILGKNSISFPSLIVLDENSEVLDVISSYIPAVFLNDIAHFYGDNFYKTKTWDVWAKEKYAVGKK